MTKLIGGDASNDEGVAKTHQLITDEDKKALKFSKPQPFKFLYPDELELAKPNPQVIVRNQDNTIVGGMPFTQAIKELFYGSPHFYVLGVYQGNKRLHILKMIDENLGW